VQHALAKRLLCAELQELCSSMHGGVFTKPYDMSGKYADAVVDVADDNEVTWAGR
jgi:hypothetical protein